MQEQRLRPEQFPGFQGQKQVIIFQKPVPISSQGATVSLKGQAQVSNLCWLGQRVVYVSHHYMPRLLLLVIMLSDHIPNIHIYVWMFMQVDHPFPRLFGYAGVTRDRPRAMDAGGLGRIEALHQTVRDRRVVMVLATAAGLP